MASDNHVKIRVNECMDVDHDPKPLFRFDNHEKNVVNEPMDVDDHPELILRKWKIMMVKKLMMTGKNVAVKNLIDEEEQRVESKNLLGPFEQEERMPVDVPMEIIDFDPASQPESCMLLYIKGKKNGRMMLEYIKNGLLVYPTIEVDSQIQKKKYAELTEQEQLQDDCDVQATNIILQGLPPDVYALVNHC
nr:hypothetical protein [Tanacetum cinerariifolium]